MGRSSRLFGAYIVLLIILLVSVFGAQETQVETIYLDGDDAPEPVSADEYSLSQLNYNVDVRYAFDSKRVDAGDNITISYLLQNRDRLAVLNPYIRFFLVKSDSPSVYPTFLENKDNIVRYYDIKLDSLNMAEVVEEKIHLPIPTDLSSGTYRLDSFVATQSAPIEGDEISFFLPTENFITVNSDKTTDDYTVKVNRIQTNMAGGFAQSGPGIYNTTDLIPYELYIDNEQNTTREIIASIRVCRHNDFPHCESVYEKNYSLSISPGTQFELIEIPRPNESFSYQVITELYDAGDGTYLSYYQNRFIVMDDFAAVKKFGLRNKELSCQVTSLLTYTGGYFPSYSELDNVSIKVEVIDLLTNETIGESLTNSKLDGFDSVKSDLPYPHITRMNLSRVVGEYQLCVTLHSSDNSDVYDKVCQIQKNDNKSRVCTRLDEPVSTQGSLFILLFGLSILVIISMFIYRMNARGKSQ